MHVWYAEPAQKKWFRDCLGHMGGGVPGAGDVFELRPQASVLVPAVEAGRGLRIGANSPCQGAKV